MPLRTRMRVEMPTLTSRAAITCTIQRRRAGTTQQVLAHQTSETLTRSPPTSWPKLRREVLKAQELVKKCSRLKLAVGQALMSACPTANFSAYLLHMIRASVPEKRWRGHRLIAPAGEIAQTSMK